MAARGLEALVNEINATPARARVVAAGLSRLGIDVELRSLKDHPFHGTLYDPRTHTPLAIGYAWGKGIPVGSETGSLSVPDRGDRGVIALRFSA